MQVVLDCKAGYGICISHMAQKSDAVSTIFCSKCRTIHSLGIAIFFLEGLLTLQLEIGITSTTVWSLVVEVKIFWIIVNILSFLMLIIICLKAYLS